MFKLCLLLFLALVATCRSHECGEGSTRDCSTPYEEKREVHQVEEYFDLGERIVTSVPAPNALFNQLITFSEVPLGTVNPVYPPALYGGPAGGPTVTFDGFFVGQILVGNNAVGAPTSPLTLDPASPNTITANDGAPITLAGTPLFQGPISILFSSDVSSVGLTSGFLDALGSIQFRVFDRNGNLLLSLTNTQTGFQFFGAASNTGPVIAGAQVTAVGDEPAGFEIDDLRFFVGTVCEINGNIVALNFAPVTNRYITILDLNTENNTPFFCEKGVDWETAKKMCECLGTTLADITFTDMFDPVFLAGTGGFQTCDGRVISRSFWIRSYIGNDYGGVPLVLTTPSVTSQSATSLHGVLCNAP